MSFSATIPSNLSFQIQFNVFDQTLAKKPPMKRSETKTREAFMSIIYIDLPIIIAVRVYLQVKTHWSVRESTYDLCTEMTHCNTDAVSLPLNDDPSAFVFDGSRRSGRLEVFEGCSECIKRVFRHRGLPSYNHISNQPRVKFAFRKDLK